MEGHRSYSPGAESSWFGGEHDHEQRVPEPRSAGWSSASPVGPRSGQSLPPLPGEHLGAVPGMGPDDPGRHVETLERSALRRPQAQPPSDGIYRTSRPIIAVPLGFAAALLAIPVGRVLLGSAFGPVIAPAGVIAGVMALLGLPLLAMGLYGLATGAARVPDPSWVRVWLRPPLAYLVVGLLCCLVAGLAVR